MKRAALTVALLMAAGLAHASSDKRASHASCDVSSDYSVSTRGKAVVFTRKDAKPFALGIGGGRLFIDGEEATLSAADHERLRQLETEVQVLIPEVGQITVEAINIAFTALIEVARGLSSDPKASVAGLEKAREQALGKVTASSIFLLNEDAVEGIVEPIITEFVPELVGEAVSMAMKMAFAGEAKAKEFEARMERMEHELDTKVEARAKALEPLAEVMCKRLRRIDEIDNAIEFRLPDNQPLQLLQLDQKHRTDAP
jgi:hypothetical protein